jgi:adenine phosphoribosyltransferase
VLAGEKAQARFEGDWRGREGVLLLQRHVIEAGERVLLVDDWAETGSKALAARELIEACGGAYTGLLLLVNQLSADVQSRLEPVEFVVRAEDVAG